MATIEDAIRFYEENYDVLGHWLLRPGEKVIAAEPRRSNADLVWSHRGRTVPLDLRLGILQVLIDDGPLSLGHLLQRVRSDRGPAAAVMTLCCADLLELDLETGPIGPSTLARLRT